MNQQTILPNNGSVGTTRLEAIDACRGFCLLFLCIQGPLIAALKTLPPSRLSAILIEQMDHAEWHGCTFYDLGFPAYIMLLSMSMTLSYPKRRARGQGTGDLVRHLLVRSLALFVLGMLLHGGFSVPLADFRFTGVLQRLAIAILISGVVELTIRWPGQLVLVVVLLIGYTLIIATVAAPGYTAGDYSPEGNLNHYVDKTVLGAKTYFVTSTLGVAGTCVLGLLIGHLLQISKSVKIRAVYLLVTGIGLVNGSVIWEFVCPINRHMWSPSFVLFSGGWICILFLCLFYVPLEALQFRKWAFAFVVLGKTPLLTYALIQLLPLGAYAERVAGQGLLPLIGSLQPFILVVAQAAVLWLIVYWLQRRGHSDPRAGQGALAPLNRRRTFLAEERQSTHAELKANGSEEGVTCA